MQLVSLQLGLPKERISTVRDGQDVRWTSGIYKDIVAGPVQLGLTGLQGDGQADLFNHGGPDKAVNLYCVEHYPYWRDELGLDETQFGYGAFGENFTVSEMTEDAVCVGDIYTVGTATVQISQPRVPCYKLGRKWENAQFPLMVIESGKSGYYIRVLKTGSVASGDTLQLVDRPAPQWTIEKLNHAMFVEKTNLSLAKELSEFELLAEAWRGAFRKRLAK